ncbi:MAG: SsrA-binding protein SmpB [Pseudomonadales bacterium]
MAKKKKAKNTSNTICQNKRARHEYHIEDKIEAGIALVGWEVKSLREGRAQLVDSYITFKNGEAWLVGANMTPLKQACTHYVTEPRRERKLLLHSRQISNLSFAVEAKGHSCVALSLYWKDSKVKCEVALVRGKQQHDKRASEKEKDWNRQKQRVLSAR